MRFNKNTKSEDIENDSKAVIAFKIADEIIEDTYKHMPLLMIISFDTGMSGVSFFDIVQFLYDNYTEHQLTLLASAMIAPETVGAKKATYNSEEELNELKKDAEEKMKETEEKFLNGFKKM